LSSEGQAILMKPNELEQFVLDYIREKRKKAEPSDVITRPASRRPE